MAPADPPLRFRGRHRKRPTFRPRRSERSWQSGSSLGKPAAETCLVRQTNRWIVYDGFCGCQHLFRQPYRLSVSTPRTRGLHRAGGPQGQSWSPSSLSDAESLKNASQQLFGGEFTRAAAEFIHGSTKLDGDRLGGVGDCVRAVADLFRSRHAHAEGRPRPICGMGIPTARAREGILAPVGSSRATCSALPRSSPRPT